MSFVVGFALTLGMSACKGKEETIHHELNNVIGQHVQLPSDSVFRNGRAKILVLVKDTGDCSPCSLGINEWYIYHMDMEDNGLQGDIIYVLRENVSLPHSVDTMLEEYGLYKCCGYEELMRQNLFLQKCDYFTFLLSSDDKVLLVGSPIAAPKLWSIYKKALGEYTVEGK